MSLGRAPEDDTTAPSAHQWNSSSATIRAHRDGILTAVELGLSNSKLEGLNSKIRLINHQGFGHHSPAALISMIYLCCGGFTVELPTGTLGVPDLTGRGGPPRIREILAGWSYHLQLPVRPTQVRRWCTLSEEHGSNLNLQRSMLARRDFLRVAAVGGAAGLLAACGQGSSSSSSSSPSTPGSLESEPGNLTDFTWAGYDVPDLFSSYKRDFGTPKFSFMTDDYQAFAKVSGGYRPDVIHACSSGFYTQYVDAGLIQPWDTSLISNFEDLNPTLVKAGQYQGEQYLIPEEWGFSSLMYRTDLVTPSENSWKLMFDEKYAGKITWWDSADTLVVDGLIQGFPHPSNMSDQELEAAKQQLTDNIHVVRNLWAAETDMLNDFKAGNVWITYAWPPDVLAMKKEGLDVTYMSPDEGRFSWFCGFLLLKDTQNYRHAHEYVDSWSSPQTAEWMMNNYSYGHSNIAVDLNKVDPELVSLYELENPDALSGEGIVEYEPIARLQEYSAAWNEVKAAAG